MQSLSDRSHVLGVSSGAVVSSVMEQTLVAKASSSYPSWGESSLFDPSAFSLCMGVPTRRILVVEDEPPVLGLLVRILKKNAWEVVGVASGEEALDLLATHDFNAVLSDLELGLGRTGLDLLADMPQRNKNARFVILTGKGTEGRCREAFLRGAADFLDKPIHHARLLAALEPTRGGDFKTQVDDDDTDRIGSGPSQGVRHVTAAIRAMELRYSELDLTSTAIANEADVSAEYLCRLFKLHVGHTPLRHLHNIRIDEASRLLLSSALGVYEVARNCGYHTTAELDLHFARRCGCSPSEFRRRQGNR